jgi:hypothetical protein
METALTRHILVIASIALVWIAKAGCSSQIGRGDGCSAAMQDSAPATQPSKTAPATRPSKDISLDSFEPKDWPFASLGWSVPRDAARSLVRSARRRKADARTSEDVNRVLVAALLADRSPATFDILVAGFPTAVRPAAFFDWGGSDKLISIQVLAPSRSKQPRTGEEVTIDIADPRRIQGLEDQQVWLRKSREGMHVFLAPESRPETPRIRVVEYTKPTLPRHYLEGHVYFRGVGVQIDPGDLLDAAGIESFKGLLTIVAANLVHEYDDLFHETVEVVTGLGRH